ncbi:hypothetical protein [Microbacterium alcoholitolerans]
MRTARIVVLGGTGQIGAKTITRLRRLGLLDAWLTAGPAADANLAL